MPQKRPSKAGEPPKRTSPKELVESSRQRALRWSKEVELRRAGRLSLNKSNKTKGQSVEGSEASGVQAPQEQGIGRHREQMVLTPAYMDLITLAQKRRKF